MSSRVPVTALDRHVMRYLARHRHHPLTRLAHGLEWLGEPRTAVVAGLAVAVVVVLTRRWRTGLTIGSAAVAALVGSEVLKRVFRRPRPPASMAILHPGGFGFPSAAACLTMAVVLAVLLELVWPSRLLRWPGVVVGSVLVVVSGWAVMYLGVHWLTDVLAGWVLGAAIALTAWRVSPVVVDAINGRLGSADSPPART